jgi:hypothetical protein
MRITNKYIQHNKSDLDAHLFWFAQRLRWPSAMLIKLDHIIWGNFCKSNHKIEYVLNRCGDISMKLDKNNKTSFVTQMCPITKKKEINTRYSEIMTEVILIDLDKVFPTTCPS